MPALHVLASHLHRLAETGCDGILLLGTAGEAPSFSADERITLTHAAAAERIGAGLVVGTGAASLTDTITLTRAAFNEGADGVMIAPPFFYRQAPPEGLFAFYCEVFTQAVPGNSAMLLYHYPTVTGVPISFELIRRLRDKFPNQLIGIKDSSGDREHLLALHREFPELRVFVGNDQLLADNLVAGGAGAITALANVFPEMLRSVYDAHHRGQSTDKAQAKLTQAKVHISDLPTVSAVKALLVARGLLPNDYVRPPLQPLPSEDKVKLLARFGLGASSS